MKSLCLIIEGLVLEFEPGLIAPILSNNNQTLSLINICQFSVQIDHMVSEFCYNFYLFEFYRKNMISFLHKLLFGIID